MWNKNKLIKNYNDDDDDDYFEKRKKNRKMCKLHKENKMRIKKLYNTLNICVFSRRWISRDIMQHTAFTN